MAALPTRIEAHQIEADATSSHLRELHVSKALAHRYNVHDLLVEALEKQNPHNCGDAKCAQFVAFAALAQAKEAAEAR